MSTTNSLSPSLAQHLLAWYATQGRDLPWRHTRDPYAILVSECMLQQTQVARVIAYFLAWMHQFPTWKSLANASNAEVIRAWSGLGYNRRALALRDIARQVVAYGVPQTLEAWDALKGVGPYTAAALCAFALQQRVFPIDTNTRRTGGRLLLGVPYPTPDLDTQLTQASEHLLPKRGAFYDIPQALFDLANSYCTKVPSCATCPFQQECLASQKFLSGTVHTPKAMIKKSRERVRIGKKVPDRIYRGRILQHITTHGATTVAQIGTLVDATFSPKNDTEWIEGMLRRMEKDHLITITKGLISLP